MFKSLKKFFNKKTFLLLHSYYGKKVLINRLI